MESIFESLENLNISEECFNEILDIVENIMSQAIKRERAARTYFGTDKAEPVQRAQHVINKVSDMWRDTLKKTSNPNRGNMTEYTPKNVRLYGDNNMTKAEAGRRLNKNRIGRVDKPEDIHKVDFKDKIRSKISDLKDKVRQEMRRN